MGISTLYTIPLFLPKMFPGSRKAQELNYLIRSRRPWSSSALSQIFVLPEQVPQLLWSQFATGQMQVTALPCRVLCSQTVRNDGDGPKQIQHRDKMLWACTFSKAGMERRCCLLCRTKCSHPAAILPRQSKGKQEESCISLLHPPQSSTRMVQTHSDTYSAHFLALLWPDLSLLPFKLYSDNINTGTTAYSPFAHHAHQTMCIKCRRNSQVSNLLSLQKYIQLEMHYIHYTFYRALHHWRGAWIFSWWRQ